MTPPMLLSLFFLTFYFVVSGESVSVSVCGGRAHNGSGCCAHAPVLIAPSMLSCDFAEMAKEAQRMVDAGSDWLHLDVMVRQWPGWLALLSHCQTTFRMVTLSTISQWVLLFACSAKKIVFILF
jgi:hypothetical protein